MKFAPQHKDFFNSSNIYLKSLGESEKSTQNVLSFFFACQDPLNPVPFTLGGGGAHRNFKN
jgi:hypothetical protein